MGQARRRRLVEAENEMLATSYAAVSDVNDEAQCTQVRKVTHDRVITLTGAARRSGVTWYTLAPHAGIELVRGESAWPGGSNMPRGDVDALIAFLEQHHDSGGLVVAAVSVDMRAMRASLS